KKPKKKIHCFFSFGQSWMLRGENGLNFFNGKGRLLQSKQCCINASKILGKSSPSINKLLPSGQNR
ncbi:hypothetical protein, partial [Acinetobacter baumannii]|uniref:hypothetical protein n=1 Tax=Acinetobacter baumannii TaxID=470 RepID=UPI001C079559